MAMLMPGIPQIAAAMTYECARLIMPVLYVPLPEQKYLTKIHIKIHITTPRMTVLPLMRIFIGWSVNSAGFSLASPIPNIKNAPF